MISHMGRSRIYLPKVASPPATVLEYLASHFPRIPSTVWRERMARGVITTSAGVILDEHSPYSHGLTVFYVKEVPGEPGCDEVENIVYQDDEILVADKPHGMPVTPAGNHIARALLNRLQESTGIGDLAPLHRLDRDTAGLVLFAVKPESRGRYHDLFARGIIERVYLAIARVGEAPTERHWVVKNHLAPGEPWFRRQIIDNEPANATTTIDLIETRDGLGLFRLVPGTGKKHQLRVHMNSIGFPILGDPLYPELREPSTPALPMQLLAARLAFTDPVTGARREFKSSVRLLFPTPESTMDNSG
jgi:tRNA pseudouridine32 synthase/23S rRNA pseudouridine746 synthase